MALRGSNRAEQPQVHRVTSAQEALSEEQSRRARRYVLSMAIRTVCFIAAVIASGWLQWAFLVGAVVLPYVAVIAANAGRENDAFTNEPVAPASTLDLPAAPTRVITGESSETTP